MCPEPTKCKFDVISEINILDKICKNNCFNEFFMDKFYKPSFNNYYLLMETNATLFKVAKSKNHELSVNYLPKMNLVEYLCSVGGLISMWFGISVYDIALILMKELKKRIIPFIVFIKLEKLFPTFLKFKESISSKIKKKFPNITIIVFSVLMFHQLITVMDIYLKYEIVTRFEIEKIKHLPLVRFYIIPQLRDLDKLLEIYPEMKK